MMMTSLTGEAVREKYGDSGAEGRAERPTKGSRCLEYNPAASTEPYHHRHQQQLRPGRIRKGGGTLTRGNL